MSAYDEKEFCFTWKIENFAFCCNEVLESPSFKADGLGENEWSLATLNRIKKDDGPEVTLCYLKMFAQTDEIYIDYKIELMEPSGRVLKSVENQNEFFNESPLSILSTSNIEIDRRKIDAQRYCDNSLIFRCHMKNADPKKQVTGGYCEAETKIGIDRHCFDWTVYVSEHGIRSERKEIFNLEYTKFVAEITRPGIETGGADVLEIKIFKTGEPIRRFMLCEIALPDSLQTDPISISHLFTSEEEVWALPPITEFKLSDGCDGNIFHFEFSVSSRTEELHRLYTSECNGTKSRFVPYLNCESVDSFLTLQKDLRQLLANKKHADVELRTGNAVFPVHKSILTARSPVFEIMFDQNMVESQTGIVEVHDIEEKVLSAFLDYLYTGTVGIRMDYDCAKNLLLVSDKYQVQSLREECSRYLINSLSIKNVCEVFATADMISDEKLKKSALDFMTTHAEEMLPLPEWSQWMKNNSSLSVEILSNMVLKLKESSKKH